MTSKSVQARAKELGIPLQIAITDDVRYSFCSAYSANLKSIAADGKTVTYGGECACGHNYDIEQQVEELQKSTQMQIINGELTLGMGEPRPAGDLEEY